jgi:hypothetical protein
MIINNRNLGSTQDLEGWLDLPGQVVGGIASGVGNIAGGIFDGFKGLLSGIGDIFGSDGGPEGVIPYRPISVEDQLLEYLPDSRSSGPFLENLPGVSEIATNPIFDIFGDIGKSVIKLLPAILVAKLAPELLAEQQTQITPQTTQQMAEQRAAIMRYATQQRVIAMLPVVLGIGGVGFVAWMLLKDKGKKKKK